MGSPGSPEEAPCERQVIHGEACANSTAELLDFGVVGTIAFVSRALTMTSGSRAESVGWYEFTSTISCNMHGTMNTMYTSSLIVATHSSNVMSSPSESVHFAVAHLTASIGLVP
jgi:hypothetical protein